MDVRLGLSMSVYEGVLERNTQENIWANCKMKTSQSIFSTPISYFEVPGSNISLVTGFIYI
jgi:hypothetical protein